MLEGVWSWIRIPFTALMPVRSWDRPHSQSKSSTIVYGFKTRTTEIELINSAKKNAVSRARRSRGLSINKTGSVLWHSIEARSPNHCCSGKAITVFSVCVCSLSYPASKAYAPYFVVIRGLSGNNIFFSHYLKRGRFPGGKKIHRT